MTVISRQPAMRRALRPQPITPRHPICRGDFAALVFSGSRASIGDLAGEATAAAMFKFALADPRLDALDDFARTPHMPLPLWPDHRVEPTDGVCFVFSDSGHPCAQAMLTAGAIEGDHFIVVDSLDGQESAGDAHDRLRTFASSCAADRAILVLGYGHQGAAVASALMDSCGVPASRLMVFDDNQDSRHRATEDGLPALDAPPSLDEIGAVVYSPLMRHERLHALMRAAARAGLPVLDNSHTASGLSQFVQRGPRWLDGAAHRALAVSEAGVIRARPHGLALTVHFMRDDLRRLGGLELPHLHGGYCRDLFDPDDQFDPAECPGSESLAATTRLASRSAYLSLRGRADLGFFASREFCATLWPAATQAVFPSEHVIDLGATAFERLLRGHLDGREIVSTMQTPAQRTALGIAARHFAADRPIVEVGSAFGGSALLMAAATDAQRPQIISIDPEASTRDIMRSAFQREGHADRLRQVVAPSALAIAQLKNLHGQAGLVFIDGLHGEAAVFDDFVNYAPLVAPGGSLAFHDVVPQMYSVMRMVIERVLTDQRFTPVCLVDGLLILERRESVA